MAGLIGTPLRQDQGPWMEALLGFAQVDESGRPAELPEGSEPIVVPDTEEWQRLNERLQRLSRLR